jgi:hypothetical protein
LEQVEFFTRTEKFEENVEVTVISLFLRNIDGVRSFGVTDLINV